MGMEKGWKQWKAWIKEKGLEKYFRRDNLLILVLGGILLVIIALPAGEDNGAGKKRDSITGESGTAGQGEDSTGTGLGSGMVDMTGTMQGSMAEEAYAAYLEAHLTEVLENMEGVGKVRVMVTIKSSQELVVEKEETTSRSSTDEKDAQGGSRESIQWANGESVVYRTNGSLSEPYVIKTLKPQVEGVLVVAEGAGTGNINRTITEIVQALFGVEAHKVKVVRMEGMEENN